MSRTWWTVDAKGFGSVSVRALTVWEALTEAAKRWEVEVEELKNCTVRRSET